MMKRTSCLLLWLVLVARAAAGPSALVIHAAQDTSRGFVSRDLVSQSERVLAWPEGLVSVADTATWLAGDGADLVFHLDAGSATIIGAGGRLSLAPGRYDLDTPVLLTDGRLNAFLADGRLEITDDVVAYRRPAQGVARGGTFLMLAAIAVATGVLLRAVRRRPRRS